MKSQIEKEKAKVFNREEYKSLPTERKIELLELVKMWINDEIIKLLNTKK